MPPPRDVLDAAQQLSDIYRTALDHIRAELRAAGNEPNRLRLRRRLRDLERTITQLLAETSVQAQHWIDHELPRAYERGMGNFVNHTAAVTGTPTQNVLIDFTMPSRPAVERLASGLTDDLLGATREVAQSAKRQIRAAVSDAGMAKLVEGKSLGEAQQQVAGALDAMGLGSVTYANGASVPLDVYADMAVRSTTAEAYNGGMLDAGTANGSEWFEVFDGPECGWTEHDDDDLADGSIRHIDDCEANPTAHPNCLRSFGARPDITSEDEAADAKPIGEETLTPDAAQVAESAATPAEPSFSFANDDTRASLPVPEDVASAGADMASSLSGDEVDAVRSYTTGGYRDLNEALRAGRALTPDEAALARQLDAVIAKAPPLAQPTPVWRGVHVDPVPFGASDAEAFQAVADWAASHFTPGATVSLGGYQSTSFFVDPALDASLGRHSPGVIFEIEATRGAYLNAITRFEDEAELLLGRDTQYEVLDVLPRVQFLRDSLDEVYRTVVKVRQL